MSEDSGRITFFSKSAVDTLHASLQAALKEVEERHGITLTVGSIKYTVENCVVEVEGATHREDGEVLTREATAYRDRAAGHGFDPKLLFRTFTAPDGRRFKLIGFNAKARANPFLIRAEDGTVFTAAAELIRAGLFDVQPAREEGARGPDSAVP